MVMRTAESVLLMCWPPAPDARRCRCAGRWVDLDGVIDSTSGSTAKVQASVDAALGLGLGNPLDRCPPGSNLKPE